MFVPANNSAVSFDGYKIIVPCISVGNVPQLTVDLIISTLKMSRVGFLDDECLLPLVGNDAFDHMGPSGYMHTAGEVYSSSESKTALVQLRTPIVKGCKKVFCTRFLSWIKSEKFSDVVLLSSSYAHERRDIQIRGEPYRFLLTPVASDLYSTLTDSLSWTPLEARDGGGDGAVLREDQLFIPGSGLAKMLYLNSCLEDVRMMVLVMFCSQGDNIPDAHSMADKLNKLLKLKDTKLNDPVQQWISPSSWNLMYGGPSPDTIF